jgi:hypothetical protein
MLFMVLLNVVSSGAAIERLYLLLEFVDDVQQQGDCTVVREGLH